MPKKEVNTKKQAGNDKKQEQKNKKDLEKEKLKQEQEDQEWSKGAKGSSKKQSEQEKKEELLRKKQERDLILKMEETELSAKKPTQKQPKQNTFKINIQEYTASGVDDALELLGSDQIKLDRHPEKRMKAAFASFEQRMMPLLKSENPTLKLSQLNQLLQKEWKKSKENPMNQESISYDASREEYREKVQDIKQSKQEKYRV